MQQMRPFQIAILAVFAILAIGGLYFFATFKGISGSNNVGALTIWGTLPQTAMTPTLEELKQTHQEYSKVQYIERPADTFDVDLADALASGTGPDVIIITEEQLLTERSKLTLIPFKTIPERTFKDSYISIGELFLTADGTYGIPFLVDPLVLYYNRTSLSKAGYAQAPRTWEEVLGATPALTQKNGSTISKSAIALGTYDNNRNARAIISLLLLQSGNSVSANGSRGIESTLMGTSQGTGASPAESAINFYTQFADPAKIVYSYNRGLQDARKTFIAGDTAMYIGFASEYAFLKASNPNLDFDMTAIPAPQTASSRVDYAHVYALAIPKNAKNQTGSYLVASALAGESVVRSAAARIGIAPALRSLLSSRTDSANADVYYPLTLISKAWLSPAPAVTDRIFAGMITNVISGSLSVKEALQNADDSLNAALAR
jgi:multiple sugar transport system substrate-binding protein